MKNLYVIFTFLCTISIWGQPISVNTTTYTPEQLVNQVLINQNCLSQITNVSTRTGTNFGSTNGIGYFSNTNTSFPFSQGILLTTGDVLQSPGFTTSPLSAGNTSWTGDADIAQIMANAGLPMNSTNATVLEFDFSTVKNSLSLDFMFMSEEYATYQCNSRDAIAVLLTNTQTNVTQNLAVIPSTNTPISVATIKNNIYNSLCSSQNQSYFGTLNGCAGPVCPPTNYNGQTVVFNVSATIIPNVTYHIKFVISDSYDADFDSALFLHQLNLGEHFLPNDLLVSTNNALCIDESYTIQSGLSPALFSFQWANSSGNLVGETNPNLTINTPNTYTLTYTNIATGCSFSDSIVIENYPEAPVTQPQNLFACDMGAAQYTYNLQANTPIILGSLNPANYTITYHPTLLDAQNNSNILASSYSSAPNTTIFVRIVANTTGCVTYRNFNLLVLPPPVAHQPSDIEVCETTFGSGTAIINLTTQNTSILNGQTGLGISYHYSLVDAQSGNNPIANTTNFTTGSVTIYVRVFRLADATCFDTTSFDIQVNPLMSIITRDNVRVCGSYQLPSLSAPYEYHLLPAGADAALPAGTIINSTTTVYIYNPNPTHPLCFGESSFLVTFLQQSDFEFDDITQCSPYTVPTLTYGNFYNAPSGTGTIIPAGTILDIGTVTTLYFYYQSPDDPSCVFTDQFVVTVLNEVLVDTHPNIISCDPYNGLTTPVNGTYYTASGGPNGTGTALSSPYPTITIDTTLYIYNNPTDFEACEQETSFTINIITPDELPQQSISTCSFYNLPSFPIGNFYTQANGQGTLLPTGTSITNSQTIYFYVNTNYGVNCTTNYPVNITILPPLPVDDLADVITCDPYILPTLTNGNYFTGPNGTGTQLIAGQQIHNTQTIYIYNTSTIGYNCASQTEFTITFPQVPIINPVCNSYTLTSPSIGGYFEQPNGVNPITTPITYTTSTNVYYYVATTNGTNCFSNTIIPITINHPATIVFDNQINFCDNITIPTYPNGNFYTGPNGTGTNMTGQTITNDTTLYLYVSNGTTPECFSQKQVFFNNARPVMEERDKIISCDEYVLTPLTFGNYFTGPNGTGTMLQAGSIIAQTTTIYVYAESNELPGCFNEDSFVIEINDLINYTLNNVNECISYTLPALADVKEKYYTAPNGPNGTGVELPYNHIINTLGTQTIYIYEAGTGRFNTCFDEISFNVTINGIPLVDTPTNVIACNSYTLPSLTNGQYYNQPNGVGPITNLTLSQSQTVFVYNVNPLNSNCTNQHRFTVSIYPTLEPNIKGGTLCKSVINGQFIGNLILDTELSGNDYTFQWYHNGNLLPYISNTLSVNQIGIYSVRATHILTGCVSSLISVEVIESSQPVFVDYFITNSFTNNQAITINVTGYSTRYEFRIDGGAWQNQSTFQNVPPGIHFVEVRDYYGCGTIGKLISTLDYPKFFTPNGDGQNEYWHIIGKDGQPNLKVYIFDRYGKFIKLLTQKDEGWDGTLNGQPLFANDYWFKVYYEENGIAKEFSSHFSLIR